MTTKNVSGRPVNAQASLDLRAAALRLVRENGYERVSIAAIVKQAGVARQTLYNRWDTKADLVLDAVLEETQSYAAAPRLDDPRPCRVLLEEFLANVFDHLLVNGDVLRALIAAAQQDAAFQEKFAATFILPREQMITDLLRQAQTRGELSSGRDAELISGLVHGAFWYRLLNRRGLDRHFAQAIASEVFGQP